MRVVESVVVDSSRTSADDGRRQRVDGNVRLSVLFASSLGQANNTGLACRVGTHALQGWWKDRAGGEG